MNAGRMAKSGCISQEGIDRPDDCKAYSAWDSVYRQVDVLVMQKTGKSMQWRIGEKKPIHSFKMHERPPL